MYYQTEDVMLAIVPPFVVVALQRTFSSPKNLSVPSSRAAAFCSIFSNGVNSCVGSSFLAFGEALFGVVEVP